MELFYASRAIYEENPPVVALDVLFVIYNKLLYKWSIVNNLSYNDAH